MNETQPNYWHCPSGHSHEWLYRGKVASEYLCVLCLLKVTKRDLKEHTDA